MGKGRGKQSYNTAPGDTARGRRIPLVSPTIVNARCSLLRAGGKQKGVVVRRGQKEKFDLAKDFFQSQAAAWDTGEIDKPSLEANKAKWIAQFGNVKPKSKAKAKAPAKPKASSKAGVNKKPSSSMKRPASGDDGAGGKGGGNTDRLDPDATGGAEQGEEAEEEEEEENGADGDDAPIAKVDVIAKPKMPAAPALRKAPALSLAGLPQPALGPPSPKSPLAEVSATAEPAPKPVQAKPRAERSSMAPSSPRFRPPPIDDDGWLL